MAAKNAYYLSHILYEMPFICNIYDDIMHLDFYENWSGKSEIQGKFGNFVVTNEWEPCLEAKCKYVIFVFKNIIQCDCKV